MQMYGSFFWCVRCMYAFPGSSGWSSNSPHQHPVVHLLQMTSPLIVLTPQTVSTNVMLQVCIYTHTKACACGSSSCINTVLTVLMMQLQEQSLPVRHTVRTLNTPYKHLLPSASLIFTSHNVRKLVQMASTVSPVIAMSPAVLSVIEDQPMTLPCVLLGGNPLPERQWLHNYGLVRTQRGIRFLNCFPHLAHLDSCPGLNKEDFIQLLSGDLRPVCVSEEGWQSAYRESSAGWCRWLHLPGWERCRGRQPHHRCQRLR